MKFLSVFLLTCLTLTSCTQRTLQKHYGETFDTLQAISVAELQSKMQGTEQVNAVVKGTIQSSCQDDGCWLNLDNGNAPAIHVDWDEKFHLPADISGKQVYVAGYAFVDTTHKGNPLAFKAAGLAF